MAPSSENSSLPILRSLHECADFSKTVEPFLPQLKLLPQRIPQALASLDNAKALYLDTNPLVTSFSFSIIVGAVTLVLAEINKNYSQIDRLWSILPTLYNAHYALWAHLNGLPTQRLDSIVVVSLIWSIRLTFNFWRKGGYTKGSEDYRWPIIKSHIGDVGMFVLNVTFISFAQSVLLFMVTTPTYVLLLTSSVAGEGLSVVDYAVPIIILGFIAVETVADQQQWNFHQAKHEYQKTAKAPNGWKREDLDRGFLAGGLFAYSRHPNLLAEQLIWVTLYQWAAYDTLSLYNWTWFGALSYLLIFQGSTPLTERISAGKYPEYKDYQQAVGRFFPKLTGTSDAWKKGKTAQKKTS